MSSNNKLLGIFLKEVMRQKKKLPSQLAADLGISHATIGRWLTDQDTPNIKSCRKLSEYTRIPLERILVIAGHLPDISERESKQTVYDLLQNSK